MKKLAFLNNPVIMYDDGAAAVSQMQFAAKFLQDELYLRTGIRAEVSPGKIPAKPEKSLEKTLPAEAERELRVILEQDCSLKQEEFCLERFGKGTLRITARDQLGWLYGDSWLLRKMFLSPEQIGIAEDFADCRICPSVRLRGHQLGYRDKQNTCPSWTEKEYERYIRDLLIFGANSIELLPPRTDDNLYSSHFRRDPLALMADLSRIIHSYEMAVHVWYPYLSRTIQEADFRKEMEERKKVFSSVPYIDGLLIPAGDPGDLPPREMIQAAERTAAILHEFHPAARVWLAPQSFAPNEDWYNQFYAEINKESEWLYGVCFGPWEKDPVSVLQQKVPARYRDTIRNYPDITHNIASQFEVPDWDAAFALTLGRESYNARPYAFKAIHQYHQGYVMGSITYSEGIHDDLNKMLWGGLDYQENAGAEELVRDYVRCFITPELEDDLADVILSLEKSWTGNILENKMIDGLYEKMNEIDQNAGDRVKDNFRYQMLLLRVLGDYQTKLRRRHDLELEKEAYQILEEGLAKEKKSTEIIREARTALLKTWTEPVGVEERYRMQKLADKLNKNCRIRLTTSRHGAQHMDRGAWLDTLNMPLNDFQYLNSMFLEIGRLSDEEARRNSLSDLLHREDPGEGGFYLPLGDPSGYRYVENKVPFAEDPCFLTGPLMAHSSYLIMKTWQSIGWYDEVPIPSRWLHSARTLYGTPLTVRVEGLDPDAEYELTAAYPELLGHDSFQVRICAGSFMIAEEAKRKEGSGVGIRRPDITCTCVLPKKSYENGTLTLTWQTFGTRIPCNVSELWIRKKQ